MSSRHTRPSTRCWTCASARSSASSRNRWSARRSSLSHARGRRTGSGRRAPSAPVVQFPQRQPAVDANGEDILSTPLQFLKGVGPRRAADLASAGLLTLEDLLYRFPIRYEDRSHLQPIASLKPGQTAAVAGRVVSGGLRSTRRPGFKIFEALISDASGSLRAVWFNQPFLKDVLVVGVNVVCFGQIEMRSGGGLQLVNAQYEILGEPGNDVEGETIHTGRIVPIYEKTGGVTPKIQRRIVHDALVRLGGLEGPEK